MNILVTGGAGFIGSNLVDALIDAGQKVHVWDDFSTGHRRNLNDRVPRVTQGDIVTGVMSNTWTFDVIYHLAALARIQPSFKAATENYRVNALGTARVLEIARQHGSRVVYAGSSSFYHDVYANPYSFSKWAGEELCKMYSRVYGVRTAIARFFNVYGQRHIRTGEYATVIGVFEHQRRLGIPLTVTGTGEQRRDFTHVADIVDGLLKLGEIDCRGDIFDFGTGRNHSINEVAAMFGGPVEKVPPRPGEAATTLADYRYTMHQLGWQPKQRLEDYVAKFVSSL